MARRAIGIGMPATPAWPPKSLPRLFVRAPLGAGVAVALDPGQAPVDMDRVKVIRHAIETGTYPIIPAKIADAMIAAGLLLRTPA